MDYVLWGLMMIKYVSQETLSYVSSDDQINLISLSRVFINAESLIKSVIGRLQIKIYQGFTQWAFFDPWYYTIIQSY